MYDYDILDAVDTWWRENHYPPTIRALMKLTGVSSTSVVSYTLRKLARQGHIVLRDARPIPQWVSKALKEAKKYG